MTGGPGGGRPAEPPARDLSATDGASGGGRPPATGQLPTIGEQPAGEDAGPGHGAAVLAAGRPGPGHVATALTGLREPVVVILLLIAFFTWISGKPLDGVLMLAVGVSLAADAARRARQGGPPESRPGGSGPPDSAAPRATAGRRLALVLLAGGALYVLVVGSFGRYSWPATVPVVALGAVVVVTGWRGPRHSRPAPVKLPAIGLALWGLVLVAGCLWELSALLGQPALTTSSYAHPTISTLTDPVLSTWAGRSIVLAGWLGLGWFLVER
jgi:hypothetical protein